MLRVLCNFLSDGQLRRKFMNDCIGNRSERDAFQHFQRTHVDWRWEFLSKCLEIILPLLATLSIFYDENKMLTGETSKNNSVLIREVAKAIPGFQLFAVYCLIFMAGAELILSLIHI